MKKILIIALAAVLVLSMATAVSAKVPLTSYKTPEPIVIDGVRDPAYNGPYNIATPIKQDNVAGIAIDVPANAATGTAPGPRPPR